MESALRARLAGVPPHAIDVEIAKVMAHITVPDAPGGDEGGRDVNGDIARHAHVLAAWRDAIGIGKSVGIDSLTDGDLPEELQRALLAVADDDDDRTIVSNAKLGRWLRGVNEVAIDGLLLRHVGSDRGNQLWALQTAAPAIAAAAATASAPSVNTPPAAAAAIEASQTVVSFPFMITSEMRRNLIALHYTPAAISRLTPQEAQEIINAKRFAR
jgi:hypothetical protein